MTQRLYYTDSYTTQFTAVLQEQFLHDGQTVVVLDQTFFYPASGGQPHDTGRLNGRSVVDVTIRDEDSAILHWLDGTEPVANAVSGNINWARRFDHMQQHTGQHILSQAFIQVGAAETVGFHLGRETITIDLSAKQLTNRQLTDVEMLANHIVWENRPIGVQFVTSQVAQQLPLRKIPPTRNGQLRLIDITDFDLTACGGTHVDRTGEVGAIKIIKTERRNDKLRIEFCCGQRALQDYAQKNDIVSGLMADLTTGATELQTAVSRLQADNKNLARQLKKQQAILLQYEADALHQAHHTENGHTLVIKRFNDRTPGELRQISQRIIQHQDTVVLIGLAGPKSQLIFGRSANVALDMNQLINNALPILGNASGGGSPSLAQGGGPAATDQQIEDLLQNVKNKVQREVGTFS